MRIHQGSCDVWRHALIEGMLRDAQLCGPTNIACACSPSYVVLAFLSSSLSTGALIYGSKLLLAAVPQEPSALVGHSQDEHLRGDGYRWRAQQGVCAASCPSRLIEHAGGGPGEQRWRSLALLPAARCRASQGYFTSHRLYRLAGLPMFADRISVAKCPHGGDTDKISR